MQTTNAVPACVRKEHRSPTFLTKLRFAADLPQHRVAEPCFSPKCVRLGNLQGAAFFEALAARSPGMKDAAAEALRGITGVVFYRRCGNLHGCAAMRAAGLFARHFSRGLKALGATRTQDLNGHRFPTRFADVVGQFPQRIAEPLPEALTLCECQTRCKENLGEIRRHFALDLPPHLSLASNPPPPGVSIVRTSPVCAENCTSPGSCSCPPAARWSVLRPKAPGWPPAMPYGG